MMTTKASDLRHELIKRFGYAPFMGDIGGAGASVYMDTIVGQAIRDAMLSVTKDDICEITGKHIECASPGDRYCPCNNCQAYLQRIIASNIATSMNMPPLIHSDDCSGQHENEPGGRCLDKDGRKL